jgi:DNA-binding transcriptional MerR regulator
VLCGTFVYVLDFFVVNVALPAIQRSLGAGPGAIEWVVAGFGLTSAAFLVCGGRLGDQYRRRRWFCAGLADLGVLEPADVDPDTGYRFYDTSQVTTAQVIRRLRGLGMALDQIRAVLAAPDVGARNTEIAAHLARMEQQRAQTRAAVAALRALLAEPPPAPAAQLRAIPAVTALAARALVDAADLGGWAERAFDGIAAALAASGLTTAGAGRGAVPR